MQPYEFVCRTCPKVTKEKSAQQLQPHFCTRGATERKAERERESERKGRKERQGEAAGETKRRKDKQRHTEGLRGRTGKL